MAVILDQESQMSFNLVYSIAAVTAPQFQIRVNIVRIRHFKSESGFFFGIRLLVQNLRIRKIRNKSKKESYATVNVENVQALQLQNLGLTVGDGSHVSQLPYCRYLRYRNIKVQYRYFG